MDIITFFKNYGLAVVSLSAIITLLSIWVREFMKAKDEKRKPSLKPYVWIFVFYIFLFLLTFFVLKSI